MHLVWHRGELRTHDQPPLHAAHELAKRDGTTVLPLVIIDPKIFERADLTLRRQAWFLENTRSLRESYRKLGSDLIVRHGDPTQILDELVHELARSKHPLLTAHFVRNYTPYAKSRDQHATRALEKCGVDVFSYGGQYTHEPGEVLTNEGGRYTVHGPFLKKWRTLKKPEILARPRTLPPLPASLKIGEITRVVSDIVLPETGEEAASKRLDWFLANNEANYQEIRSQPGLEDATSKLSYYFNVGVLSPRLSQSKATTYKWKFELSWWDFFADLLDTHPESANEEAVPAWRGFPWRHGKESEADSERWKNGETGFPLIDAGMRELRQTGFMHNRVRMATAEFLVRHLLIDWRQGEELFRGWLLCGDRAQNVGNWQWVAGCGLSAKAYFRTGNPVSLAKTADPDAAYMRRWLPELADSSPEQIHTLWESAPRPQNYPGPMLDIKQSRVRWAETAKGHLAKSKSI